MHKVYIHVVPIQWPACHSGIFYFQDKHHLHGLTAFMTMEVTLFQDPAFLLRRPNNLVEEKEASTMTVQFSFRTTLPFLS